MLFSHCYVTISGAVLLVQHLLFNFYNLIQIVNEIIDSISQSRKVILHDIPN